MAINRGFPSSNTISPSVRITEKDQSFVAPEQSTHRAGLVGFASKGPINEPTLISTQRQLTSVFGYPHPESGDPYLIYAAEQFLLVANELYIVRVADVDAVSDERAETAEIDVPSSGSVIRVVSEEEGPYTFAVDSFFRWRLNGVLRSKMLTVLADTYTAEELADALNAQLDADVDGIQFLDEDGFIGVETVWAFGPDAELEFVSTADAIYGGPVVDGNITGLGTGMTQAEIVGSEDRYPTAYQDAGEYDFTGLTDMNIVIVVDGTDLTDVDNVAQVIDFADLEGSEQVLADIVDHINDQKVVNGGTLPGGWEAYAEGDNLAFRTLHHGRDARLLIKASSTAAGLFGLESVTKVGASPIGTTGSGSDDTYGRINGDSNTTGAVSFTLTADSPGVDGNSTQVVIANDLREGNFSLRVLNNGAEVESWALLTKDENSAYYVESYLALVSDWIRVEDNTSNTAPPLDGTYTLTGGSDGIPSDPDDQDGLIVGNRLAYTGLYALSEPQSIDIDLIAVPGHSSTTVVTELLHMCQNVRSDCMAIIDPPFGLTVSEVVDWQNGSHPLNTTRFDSDFGALFWPWVKIRDNYNRVDIWAPPSGAVMATMAKSDAQFAPWYAAAGNTRGIVSGITDVFSRPTLEEMDGMYGYRNAVNCIVWKPRVDGFVINGNKTLQRRATALDRISVRRLMIYIEKRIRREAEDLLFDPHDEILRQKFIRIVSAILSEVQVERGIAEFRIQCDEELNTPDVIDRNELKAKIGVIPIRSAEFFFLEFSIHRTNGFADTTEL